MRSTLSCLAVGLALASAATEPAQSADWTRSARGKKDYGRAVVPVPVPAPVPDYAARWYFRTDIGLG